jgi:hypothetical protein
MTDELRQKHLTSPMAMLLLVLSLTSLQACSSIAEGVTRGLTTKTEKPPPRPCDVTGPAFQGLSQRLHRLELSGSAALGATANPQRLKVMMVHGIGTHPPGYSARFQRNLTAALGLNQRDEVIKEIRLRAPEFFADEPLGHLRIFRYMNAAGTQEMLFYELSWSEITAPAKSTLAYDTSGEHSYKRSDINHIVKVFLNDRFADPIAYFGDSHGRILESVTTGLCWMTISDWDDLPIRGAPACDGFRFTSLSDFREDELVFVTHSLGSRILTDAFQDEAESMRAHILKTAQTAEDRENLEAIVEVLKNKQIRIYMLANQLPLLQLGTSLPPVVDNIDNYCRRNGSDFEDRYFSKLSIVAFSDPNDALSYAIPPGYENAYIDSRLCPEIVNVSVNVAEPIDLFGFGEVVNPMTAHASYEDDPRVIGLIADGIGHEKVNEQVSAECTWLETVN